MTDLWGISRAALVVAAAGLLAACPSLEEEAEQGAAPSAAKEASRDEKGPVGCRIESRAVTLPDGVGETSGVAESRRTPGVYWTHNDSGGEPILYAFAPDGRGLGAVRVTGARNRDWEDVAVTACEGGSCVLVGDIGDNTGRKREISLWRVPEPAPTDTASAPATRYDARFPGDRGDAEALFALPDGSLYLITKGTRRKPIELFRWPTPLSERGAATLQRVRQLAPPPAQPGDEVTGAGASPNGRWVAVRTYASLVLYRTQDLLGSGEPALAMDLLPLAEGQGEGVSLGDDGTVILTSENREGGHLPGTTSRLACTLPE